MRKTRAVGLTALAAVAALVMSACSGTPGQATDSTTAATTAASGSESSAAASGSEGASAPLTPPATEVGASACGIPHGAFDPPATQGGEVRASWNDPLLSFNNGSSRGNAAANTNPLYLTNQSFSYYDKDLNYINNDQFGTCTIESTDPLTIKYTVNEGVTWSDGVQIGAADMVMFWAARSGNFNDSEAETDDEGNLLPAAGVAFDAADVSLALIKDFPVIGDDGRSATFTWSEFFVDYSTAGIGVGNTYMVPAHVVAQKALGIADPQAASDALIAAFQANDKTKIKPISDFWNTGFDADQLPADPSLYLSSGPYKVTAYAQRANMTFERNPDYDWGPIPSVDKITYSVIGDPTAMVQALTNEEIDMMQPQATADIYQAVVGLADRGILVETGDDATYEHVDLVFNNGGPFDPATYGGDAAKALKVRQAFLKTIPRQDIVDRLIKPISPTATLRQSFTTVPGAPGYDDIAENNGMSAYDVVDIPGAKQLLTEAGVTGPIDVRLKYAANNPRRSNEYDLMKASALEAGFNLVDGQSPSWGQELPSNNLYDASLFGWQSTSVDIASSSANNFVTGAQNNYGGYSSQAVDDALGQLQSQVLTPDEQQALKLTTEQQLVDDAFGTVIFQFPAVTAWNDARVKNVSSIALSPTIFWNFWEWEAA